MYCEWRLVRNLNPNLRKIVCNMDDITSLTISNVVEGICRFLTEIKKLDRSEFSGIILYDLVICLQFHLETKGFSWKFLSENHFKDIRFTLDNLMKDRCARGIGVNVRKVQVLTQFHKEIVWSMGLLGNAWYERSMYFVEYCRIYAR